MTHSADGTENMTNQNDDRDKVLAWARQTLENVVAEISDEGVIDNPLLESRLSWIMPSEFVIGQLRGQGSYASFFWVVGGPAMPIDCAHSNVASSPREAARHFAMKWQLDATRLDGEEAGELIQHAEHLYALADSDQLWT